MKNKVCSKCKVEKPDSEFSINNSSKDGINYRCKNCINEWKKEYRENNKEKLNKENKEYHERNKESVKKRRKKYHERNKEKLNKESKEYRENNKEKLKEYRKRNKKKKYEHKKNRLKTDINFKLRSNLSSRIRVAVKNKYGKKARGTVELLGENIQFVREYLENKFTEGMTWENYGEWHIDHIIPCASFDLTDPDQQKKCFHYTNLQPLWAEDNWSKGDKII